MAYNISGFVNDSATLGNMITQINQASNGFFIGGVLILVFLIIFIALKMYETRVGLLAASMVGTLLTVFAWWGEWIQFTYILIPAVLLFVSLLWNALGE